MIGSTPQRVDHHAVFLAFQNRGDLAFVIEGDKRLFNQYGPMLVNRAKYSSVKKDLGQQFIDFLISREEQKIIAGYKSEGQQLFYPNAHGPNARREWSSLRSPWILAARQ